MHSRRLFKSVLLAVAIALVATPLYAKVTLPHVFTDHMVLQREMPVIVWGWAEAGEPVTVRLGADQAATQAKADGQWKVTLPARPASSTPLELTVTGKNTLKVSDILVGEVWLCSGQSNMEWGLGGAETGQQEVAQARHPRIRLLKINARPNFQPVPDITDSWSLCTPETVPGFSAVGYFFGKHLHQELDVPVGLIEAAWGGTRIEPWTSRAGFAMQPKLADIVKRIDEANKTYHDQLPAKLDAIETWARQTRRALAENSALPLQPDWPRHALYFEGHPTEPTCLYNTRIGPIVPFAMRGAIWYQGESNMGENMLYYEKTKALVSSWRQAWNQKALSFYYVQLAPFRPYGKDLLPRLWEAQTACLGIGDTGMAVVHDIGNVDDIHPRNKRDVGKRLALWALAKNYGRSDLVYSGPLYKAMNVAGSTIEITFDHIGAGLTTRDGKAPDWFEIAGSDKQFHPAQAKIVGDKVVVSCPEVAAPVAVRFAWDNAAEPNLKNKDGLPASSFRTDDWEQ